MSLDGQLEVINIELGLKKSQKTTFCWWMTESSGTVILFLVGEGF